MARAGTTDEARVDARSDELPLPRWLVRLCGLFAALGGAVLCAMMAMTVASVTLRGLTGRPIPGDFELVEQASAIAVFCFLPWCQIRGGHALVDVFTLRAGPGVIHALGAVASVVFAALAALIAWRMALGAAEFYRYGQQTMVLRLPVWWGFVVILPAMALLVLACIGTAAGHLRRLRG